MKPKKLICNAIMYILERSPQEISRLTVGEIASYLNVTVSHLSRSFRDEMGTNIKKFIQREKIFTMRFLLIQREKLTIREIADYFDFSSCNYFIEVFKKQTGVTPGQFRKKYKGFIGFSDRRTGPADRRKKNMAVEIERRKDIKGRRDS